MYLGGILIPVAPGKIDIRTRNNNKTITLLNEGEYSILKNKGLDEITFTIVIPSDPRPYAKFLGGFLPIQYFINKFEEIKNSKTPVTLVILRDNKNISSVYNTSKLVSLEDYSFVEDVNAHGKDVAINIVLKEYKGKENKVIETMKKITDHTGGIGVINFLVKKREITQEVKKTYLVKIGDTLPLIAKKELGDASKSESLKKINSLENGFDLEVGGVIRLE